MNALIIVDVQNDFCPGGALAVKHGDRVVPVINRLMERFDVVVASKDWHPRDSVHFEKWPVHCVAETKGAEFHPKLDAGGIQQIFLKGTENKDDGYSAFEATNVDLTSYLKARAVKDVYVAGLATDYCVKATALDAQKAGFKTHVITDAVRGVEASPGDCRAALNEMANNGVIEVDSRDIPAIK